MRRHLENAPTGTLHRDLARRRAKLKPREFYKNKILALYEEGELEWHSLEV